MYKKTFTISCRHVACELIFASKIKEGKRSYEEIFVCPRHIVTRSVRWLITSLPERHHTALSVMDERVDKRDKCVMTL